MSQDNSKLYPYIDNYITSPLAFTICTGSNTTGAICRTKMQLVSSYFDSESPSDLFANGTVKLDYVGRRLHIDVPLTVKMKHPLTDDTMMHEGRILDEGRGKVSMFALEVELAPPDSESAGLSSMNIFISIGSICFSVAMAFLITRFV